MTASTRIYAGGAIAFGGQPVINDLLNAGYNTVIVWSVHVAPDGSLILNNTQIVSGGVYQEAEPMDLQTQYQTRGSTVDGGFIWLYDSVISCLLSTCCGGSIEQPVGTALAYREAITNGLS